MGDEVSTGFSYNNNTGVITLLYNIPSGVSDSIQILVTQGDTTICDETSTSSAGSINCNVSGYTNEVRVDAINSEGSVLQTTYYNLDEYFRTFGSDGLLWAFFSILTVGMAGLALRSISMSIVMTGFIIGAFSIMGLIGLQLTTVVGIFGLIAFILFKMRSP